MFLKKYNYELIAKKGAGISFKMFSSSIFLYTECLLDNGQILVVIYLLWCTKQGQDHDIFGPDPISGVCLGLRFWFDLDLEHLNFVLDQTSPTRFFLVFKTL